MTYRAVKKNGYGECVSSDINYIINNVEKWCGPYFDLYVDDVKVDNPKEYLEKNRPKTLEDKIVDMCFKIDSLQEENKRLKEVNEEVREEIEKSILIEGVKETGVGYYENIKANKTKLLQILDKAKENK